MLETIFASLLIAQADHLHLTPIRKVAVERRIVELKGLGSDTPIAPREISTILGIQPQCGKKPDQAQIHCVWAENNREIVAYWSEPWKFQRWEARGF
jgi:hypothetical protein